MKEKKKKEKEDRKKFFLQNLRYTLNKTKLKQKP